MMKVCMNSCVSGTWVAILLCTGIQRWTCRSCILWYVYYGDLTGGQGVRFNLDKIQNENVAA